MKMSTVPTKCDSCTLSAPEACKVCKVSVSHGNMKVGTIPNVSLAPILTCAPRVPCVSECYALKAWNQYPAVRDSWTRNTRVIMADPFYFFRQVSKYCDRVHPDYFRFWVSGDWPNAQAVQAAIETCIKPHPETRFLAFTKQHALFGHIDNYPENLSIVFSLWPNWGDLSTARAQGFPVAFMQDGLECRVHPARAVNCPGSCSTCKLCWYLSDLDRDVVFPFH